MKFFVVIGLVCVALVGELAQAARLSSDEWTLFKRQHGKNYESLAEDARRFAIFTATKQRVESHNARGDSSFKMGLNHLADWTQEELAKLTATYYPSSAAQKKSNKTEAHLAKKLGMSKNQIPDEFDWRQVPGRVTSVKDQGQCSAGWAFAAAGVLEGQEIVRVFNESSQVVDLSAQEFLDCSETNYGCFGGNVFTAFYDLGKLGGIVSSEEYPYKAEPTSCELAKKKAIMAIGGQTNWPLMDEPKLKQMLVKYGPIGVAIQATSFLHMYSSGVFSDDTCSTDELESNHSMLLVGYGTDPKQGDYWIVKNSWGADWGEKGYFKIKLGVNMCGIANMPSGAKF